jgi:carbonic anhydrase
MKLFESILEANQRATDPHHVEVDLAPQGDALPIAALTCIDARLNHLIPEALGVPEEKFIWLRNAGNILTGPLSSTMRSLALACAVKGAREIAIIGHTDCLVGKTTMLKLTDAMKTLGLDRQKLPENLNEYFGLFASERQNVIRGTDFVRSSPLIGPNVPVHGLLLDIQTGKLEWLVNGYQTLGRATASFADAVRQTATETIKDSIGQAADLLSSKLQDFKTGEMKFPEFKIGETTINPNKWLSQVDVVKPEEAGGQSASAATSAATTSRAVTARQASPNDLERLFDKALKYKVIGSDQKVYGPIQGMKILEWLAEGRINWQTPAQAAGASEWKPLAHWVRAAERVGVPLPPPIKSLGRSGKEGGRGGR